MVSKAGANDGVQTQTLLEALILQPPAPETPHPQPDVRDLPRARADGAYGNNPTTARAAHAGFRMTAPKRGQTRKPEMARGRGARERGHAFLAQLGRMAQRLDRSVRRFRGWIELAAGIIFLRAQANGFVR